LGCALGDGMMMMMMMSADRVSWGNPIQEDSFKALIQWLVVQQSGEKTKKKK